MPPLVIRTVLCVLCADHAKTGREEASGLTRSGQNGRDFWSGTRKQQCHDRLPPAVLAGTAIMTAIMYRKKAFYA